MRNINFYTWTFSYRFLEKASKNIWRIIEIGFAYV